MKTKTTSVSLLLCALLFIVGCSKQDQPSVANEELSQSNGINGHLKQTKTYSGEVAQKWHDLQLRILRLPAGANPY